ncbi:MAG TPA: Gfo/Idh/MocA family oxidoreductase [Planctomycetota bacterium]|nr:Gfo/Idh/MocA family oxidoreductase [Planctomycetota bacterium]
MASFNTIENGRPIRVIQTGCGEMAQAWVERTLRSQDLQLVGLVDLRREAAEKTARRFNLSNRLIFNSLKEALTAAQPDAVFDATVPASHCAVTLQALKAGCHVLGEKPLSDNIACAKKMCAAAKKARRLVAVTQNRRFNEHAAAFRAALAGGLVGDLSSLDADFYLGAHFDGYRLNMPHVLLLDMAIHTFDQARMLSGCDPLYAYCREFHPKGSWFKGEAGADCIFEMTRGVIFTYRGSWAAEGFGTSWESAWRAIGSKGTIVWDGASSPRAQVPASTEGFLREARDVPVPPVPLAHTGHDGSFDDFFHALRTGRDPQCICHDNIKSLAMCFAAIDSAKSGKRVKIQI